MMFDDLGYIEEQLDETNYVLENMLINQEIDYDPVMEMNARQAKKLRKEGKIPTKREDEEREWKREHQKYLEDHKRMRQKRIAQQ